MNSHHYEAKVRKKVRKERTTPRSIGLTRTLIIIRCEVGDLHEFLWVSLGFWKRLVGSRLP